MPDEPGSPPPSEDDDKVVSIERLAAEREHRAIENLVQDMTARADEGTAVIVEAYRAWERAHRDQALRTHEKLEMAANGFVGRVGFHKCHDETRLPVLAFLSGAGREPEDGVRGDDELAERMLCPALESGKCRAIWEAMKLPPCRLLLLEIHHGLGGGGGPDWGVTTALDAVGRTKPEEYERTFARAKALVKKYDELEERAERELRERGPRRDR